MLQFLGRAACCDHGVLCAEASNSYFLQTRTFLFDVCMQRVCNVSKADSSAPRAYRQIAAFNSGSTCKAVFMGGKNDFVIVGWCMHFLIFEIEL